MISHSTWIVGASRSGKTARLVDIFSDWLQSENHVRASFYTKNSDALKGGAIAPDSHLQKTAPRVLVLAANSENRRELADKIVTAIKENIQFVLRRCSVFFKMKLFYFGLY